MRKSLATFVGAVALLWKVLSSYGGVDGKPVYPTGNNPHNWPTNVLEKVVTNSSDVARQMTPSENPWEDSFVFGYTIYGLNFSNTNKYKLNLLGEDGNLYGVGLVDTNGQGTLDMYVNGHSISDTNAVLATNTLMYANLVESNGYVWAMNPTGYRAQPSINWSYQATNPQSWKVVGSIDSDQDRFLDYVEDKIGTDKNNPNDVLMVTNISHSGNNVRVSWNTTNVPCNVEKRVDLMNASWSNLVQNITAGFYVDTNVQNRSFYRVKAVVE